MARPVPLVLQHRLVEGRIGPTTFRVSGGKDHIDCHGAISVSGLGWTLTGRALRKRNAITIYVTASRQTTDRNLDLEDHDYSVTLKNLTPGRYTLRVMHQCIQSGEETHQAVAAVYDAAVMVGQTAPAMRARV
jgi:hypothetical protein